MTDETRELFDAPWAILSDTDSLTFEIRNKVGESICDNILMFYDANRLARLPELYDALMEVAYEHCQLCIFKNSESASKMPSPNDMATNGGASFCFQNCPRLKHWKLLKKVRDGV